MITIKQIQKKIVKLEKTNDKNIKERIMGRYVGFWDFEKNELLFRGFFVKKMTPPKQNERITHIKETFRYFVKPHTMIQKDSKKEWNNQKQDWDIKVKKHKVTAHAFSSMLFENNFGMGYRWKTYCSQKDENVIPIALTKLGKPYKLEVDNRLDHYNDFTFGYWDDKDITRATPSFNDITKLILSDKELKRFLEYKDETLKTSRPLSEFIDFGEYSFYPSFIHKYLNLAREFEGLHFLKKHDLYKFINKPFLKLIDEPKNIFSKDWNKKHSLREWFLNQVHQHINRKKTKYHLYDLNTTNLVSAFNGEDIEKKRRIQQFKMLLGKIIHEGKVMKDKAWNYDTHRYISMYVPTNKRTRKAVDYIREYLTELPIFKKGADQYDLSHFIDYLEWRLLTRDELPKAVILNKNWREDFQVGNRELSLQREIDDYIEKVENYIIDLKLAHNNMQKYEGKGSTSKELKKSTKDFKYALNLIKDTTTRVYNQKYNKILFQNENWLWFQSIEPQTAQLVINSERIAQEKEEKENNRIVKKIKEIADFIGVQEKDLKQGEQTSHFLMHAPKDLKNWNEHGTALSHCYVSNSGYWERHINKEKVLIFIEKDNLPFATATLHPDGTVTSINIHQDKAISDKAEGKEKELIIETIKNEFYPKLFKQNISVEA